MFYRSSILTGRYQSRTGVYPGVFICGSRGGKCLMFVIIYTQDNVRIMKLYQLRLVCFKRNEIKV